MIFKYVLQLLSWPLKDLDRSLQRLTNILYINNALSRRDRPRNIGIIILLFTIEVCGFF